MVRRAENGADLLDREKSKRLRALAALWPFLRPYRALLAAAVAALVLTAAAALILPMAVRRVVDNFGGEDGALLDQYFGGALFIAALLALGTGLRYLLVSRLGERVVADIRKAVFDRVIAMSPAFYERLMVGEVISIRAMPPIRIRRLRSAMETEEEITLSSSVVSVVIRLRTSPVITRS